MCLRSLYDLVESAVQVWINDSTNDWVQHGTDISVSFATGDVFGVAALSDGKEEVFKCGSLEGTRDVSAWPYYDDGGYIGHLT